MATRRTQATRIAELEDRIEELEDRLEETGHGDHAVRGADYAPAQICSLPVLPPREFDPNASLDRQNAIVSTGNKWVNGTNIHYYMFPNGIYGGSAAEQQVVRDAFQIWKDVGIGLTFTEVTDIQDAELRIGFPTQ